MLPLLSCKYKSINSTTACLSGIEIFLRFTQYPPCMPPTSPSPYIILVLSI